MIEVSETPAWPTTMRTRLRDGRLGGVDNSLWLYGKVPLAPVVDAKSPREALEAATPVFAMFEELADMVNAPVKRRAWAKGSYRQVHLLLLNIPQPFDPGPDHQLSSYLRAQYPDELTFRRLLLFGVRLTDRIAAGGFKKAVDSVVETILSGSTPLSDFDEDTAKMRAAMSRSGLKDVTAADINLANAWWNHGRNPDTPFLFHPDHVHVLPTVEAMYMADAAGADNCANWAPGSVPDEHSITFGSVSDLDLEYVSAENPRGQWVADLLRHDALAVSIRGSVEPGAITREELRRQRKRFIDDINERYKQGKMSDARQEEMLGLLESVEGLYSAAGSNAPPTLASASIVVGFNGRFRDVTSIVPAGSVPTIAAMMDRQNGAMAETWLCSHLRANPNLLDIPAQTIACSGIPSLSFVGDRDGALLGLSETDRQPSWVSPTAASRDDAAPLFLVAGATGSGKAERVDTPIPTPTGFVRMGDLTEGDLILGRDGRAYPVEHAWPINENPELFRIRFSDGQVAYADRDHQWLVSDFHGRNSGRKTKRLTAIETWERKQELVLALNDLASRTSGEMTLRELNEHLRKHLPEAAFGAVTGLRAALDMVEAPFMLRDVITERTFYRTEITKTDPVLVYPVKQTLSAVIDFWSSTVGGNATRWGARQAERIAAARAVLADAAVADDQSETLPQMARMLQAHGAVLPSKPGDALRVAVKQLGIVGRPDFRQVSLPIDTSQDRTIVRESRVYDAQIAVKALATRLAEQYFTKPSSDALEVRMTTGEMLAAGLRLRGGQAQFGVRIAQALDLPHADLPVDPYTLGAWLGDGSSIASIITSDPRATGSECQDVSDSDHLIGHLRAAGYLKADRQAANDYVIGVPGLLVDLRAAGVLGNKHIPMAYLRASIEQRLALLQGLMDTDGTVDVTGSIEISLSDKTLAADTLGLIRSLGIKASVTWDQPASYRDRTTGDLVECKDRHRIHFTTDMPVFRLPRKLARQRKQFNEGLRETAKWLYITDIEPVLPGDADYAPARCITVGSPDRTYLTGQGYIPTSNTMVMLRLAEQFARMKRPTIVWDPKQASAFDAVADSVGGQTYSLDSLLEADGVFDPIRFSPSDPSRGEYPGVEIAADMLMSINPWGDLKQNMEVPLLRALQYGVERGGTCIGQALAIAKRDLPNLPPQLISAVEELASASSQFRAVCGVNPTGQTLVASDTMTLIKVGKANLNLPKPGAQPDNIQQRISMAIVRMVVFGSATALMGRDGVLLMDEAWIILGASEAEVERLGRLARSQRILPILFTQRVTDALNAGLKGYISRGLILPLRDETEALSACELFDIEPTYEIIDRITALGTVGGSAEDEGAPNWNSMRHLRDPRTRETLRGTVGLYADLKGAVIPVEIKIPKAFIDIASTNPEDVDRRRREMAARLAAETARGEHRVPDAPEIF